MTISELQEMLEEFKKEEGDIDVVIYDYGTGRERPPREPDIINSVCAI